MPPIKLELTAQSVVCLLPPNAKPLDLDIEKLVSGLDVGEEHTLVRQAPVAAAQYENLQIFAGPGRVQLDLRVGAEQDLIDAMTTRVLEAVRMLNPVGIGLNGVFALETTDGFDPTSNIVNTTAAAEVLGAEAVRGGFKLMTDDGSDGSRWTWGVEPTSGDADAWVVSLNRHYPGPLAPESVEAAVAWFVNMRTSVPEMIRKLAGVSDE